MQVNVLPKNHKITTLGLMLVDRCGFSYLEDLSSLEDRALARLGSNWIWSQTGGCKNCPINSKKSVHRVKQNKKCVCYFFSLRKSQNCLAHCQLVSLGFTAGNSWTGIQANTLGILPLNDIHKIVKKFTRSDLRKVAKRTPALLLNPIQIKKKVIPG